MKNQESPPSTAVNRKQPASKSVDALVGEVNAFLDHPRAHEILLGEWLHDSSLPAPSAELLDYFAGEALCAPGRLTVFHLAETAGVSDAVKRLIHDLKVTPPIGARSSVVATLQRQKLLRLVRVGKGGSGVNSLGWWLLLWGFRNDSADHPLFPQGERRMAQVMFQAMMLRAVFYQDVKRLEGLAEAARASLLPSEINPPAAHLIAVQMFRWMPYLREKLGRSPQKSEMQFFLLDLHTGLSDSPKDWSEAAKIIRFEQPDRSKRVDRDLLLKIVVQAKNEGPAVKLKVSWRTSPHRVGDDLPK